jgi:hypothetical protein
MKSIALALLVAACGGNGGNGSPVDAAPDSKIFQDAPPNVPAMIAISGTATEDTQNGSSPLAGVAIGIYKTSDETTALATATTDAQGKYSVMIATGGHVVDAFLKASKSGYVDNYAYPAAPYQADITDANANLITTGNYGFLKLLGGGHDGKGIIVVEILDSSDQSVAGATVTSSPASGAYRYSDSSGTPTATTSTAADGAAFMFDVPPGPVQISAMKTGMTFKTHGLSAHADQFTTTVITQ